MMLGLRSKKGVVYVSDDTGIMVIGLGVSLWCVYCLSSGRTLTVPVIRLMQSTGRSFGSVPSVLLDHVRQLNDELALLVLLAGLKGVLLCIQSVRVRWNVN